MPLSFCGSVQLDQTFCVLFQQVPFILYFGPESPVPSFSPSTSLSLRFWPSKHPSIWLWGQQDLFLLHIGPASPQHSVFWSSKSLSFSILDQKAPCLVPFGTSSSLSFGFWPSKHPSFCVSHQLSHFHLAWSTASPHPFGIQHIKTYCIQIWA